MHYEKGFLNEKLDNPNQIFISLMKGTQWGQKILEKEQKEKKRKEARKKREVRKTKKNKHKEVQKQKNKDNTNED